MICTKSFIVYGGVFDIDKFKPTIGKFKNCISFNCKLNTPNIGAKSELLHNKLDY